MFGRGHDRIISRRQIEQNQNVIFLKPSAPPSSQGRIRVGFDAFESTRSQDLARYRSRINDRFVVKPVQILLLLEGSSKGVRSFLSLGKKIIAIISSVFQDLEVFFRAEFIPISELKHELGHRCWSWTNGNLGQHRESREFCLSSIFEHCWFRCRSSRPTRVWPSGRLTRKKKKKMLVASCAYVRGSSCYVKFQAESLSIFRGISRIRSTGEKCISRRGSS